MKYRLLALLSFMAFWPITAHAQSVINDYANESAEARNDSTEWTGYVAAGAAMLPEFDGSEDYQVIPILAGQVNKDNYYIATRGLGLVANIVDSRYFNFGPVANFRFGRDDDVDNNVIARLREVDESLELGAFASYILRDNFYTGDNFEVSLTLTQDVIDGHGGVLGDIGASYFVPVRRDLRLGVNAGLDYQSNEYMDSFFSIDANNAARSGLAQYEAGSGFHSGSLGGMALYSFNRQWGMVGIAQYTRWMGDASDSPIIKQEGSENQFFGALGVTYRF